MQVSPLVNFPKNNTSQNSERPLSSYDHFPQMKDIMKKGFKGAPTQFTDRHRLQNQSMRSLKPVPTVRNTNNVPQSYVFTPPQGFSNRGGRPSSHFPGYGVAINGGNNYRESISICQDIGRAPRAPLCFSKYAVRPLKSQFNPKGTNNVSTERNNIEICPKNVAACLPGNTNSKSQAVFEHYRPRALTFKPITTRFERKQSTNQVQAPSSPFPVSNPVYRFSLPVDQVGERIISTVQKQKNSYQHSTSDSFAPIAQYEKDELKQISSPVSEKSSKEEGQSDQDERRGRSSTKAEEEQQHRRSNRARPTSRPASQMEQQLECLFSDSDSDDKQSELQSIVQQFEQVLDL